MSEYRRFIAYFYEYIDGKKQRNAGFAKVELRSGMWRILFRLTEQTLPQSPARIYGFVRRGGYLPGFPIGEMRMGRERAEEWAWRADAPVGPQGYTVEQLSGLWIRSGDGRLFISVWDDEPVNPEKLLLELPQEEKQDKGEQAAALEGSAAEIQAAELPGENLRLSEAEADLAGQTVDAGAEPGASADTVGFSGENLRLSEAEADLAGRTVDAGAGEDASADVGAEPMASPGVERLLCGRPMFTPFRDGEIRDCVQIMPCDLLQLRREHWQVGRSSFLQHGYSQYRHLLLGRADRGRYVLGVPGVQNEQEQYMARLFGFDRFKTSRICDCGRRFGYWCKTLEAPARSGG